MRADVSVDMFYDKNVTRMKILQPKRKRVAASREVPFLDRHCHLVLVWRTSRHVPLPVYCEEIEIYGNVSLIH